MRTDARDLVYAVTDGKRIDADFAAELSALFSANYGTWSRLSPVKPGGMIRLGPAYYQKSYCKGGYRVATCRDAGRLVAQAVYLVRKTSCGAVALVVQLVVDAAYRRRGIATTLLHAIWGFSDFYAWGIVTSSPCTVEALEAATFRRCYAGIIGRYAPLLEKEVLKHVGFLAKAPWTADASGSMVDTRFFTDRTKKPLARKQVEARLGRLDEGWEWLAFTFRDQPLDAVAPYERLVASSGRFVSEAYRRMAQSRQKWASRTKEEIDHILNLVSSLKRSAAICDFGAGCGRHVRELRRRRFCSVEGIDFATGSDRDGDGIVCADCRTWRSKRRYDLILCLYDVIGSFSDDGSNLAILKNIARHLNSTGCAVVSVANYNYKACASMPRVDGRDRATLLEKVFRLKPVATMATSGEFFRADAALVSESDHLFYHKEQFGGAGELPGEYLVVDRRYTAEEFSRLAAQAGLVVSEQRFVCAGFEPKAEADGKEILFLLTPKKGKVK